ncbi:unnamed protein product, partial [marine sediment metagenome]
PAMWVKEILKQNIRKKTSKVKYIMFLIDWIPKAISLKIKKYASIWSFLLNNYISISPVR